VKTIHAVCAILVIAFSLVKSDGATRPGQVLPIGDLSTVTAYGISKVHHIRIEITGVATNGAQFAPAEFEGTNNFESKGNLDVYIAQRIQEGFGIALTNQWLDKAQPCQIYVICDNEIPPFPEAAWAPFWVYKSFIFPQSNGVYRSPDPADFPLTMSGLTTYFIPGIRWAVCETFAKNTGARVNTWDSRTNGLWYNPPSNPSGGVDTNHGVLILKTSYITDNLSYSNKITLVDGTGYYVIDSLGSLIQTPDFTFSNPTLAQNQATVRISGGSLGQTLTLYAADDLTGPWTVCTSVTRGFNQNLVETPYTEPMRSHRFFKKVLSY
jgi:hypothetical protein